MSGASLPFETWYVIVGAMLVTMAFLRARLDRLPLTAALFYLALGVGLGPSGVGLLRFDPRGEGANVFLRLTELAVLISLFSTGLNLRIPLRDSRWRTPMRLAFLSMAASVALVALAGVLLFDLPLGAAILLGAVISPTDPVLAGDVKVTHPDDKDTVRFGLTGEAGLNDGTAFPFVMLGLGFLAHEGAFGTWLARWAAVDLVWATVSGLSVGFLLGTLASKAVVGAFRRHGHKAEESTLDEFVALGLIGLAYGVAHMIHGYGFLAVFAAGIAFRVAEVGAPVIAADKGTSTARKATDALLETNEQFERLAEVALVILVGSLLQPRMLTPINGLFLVLLLFVVRPVSVACGAPKGTPGQKLLLAWFGIRGIGSLYYLAYAFTRETTQGRPGEEVSVLLLDLTLLAVAASALAHGVSVTPVMGAYGAWRERRKRPRHAH